MSKITLVTGNRYKLKEVRGIFSEFNIEIDNLDMDKPEMKFDTIKETAAYSAAELAKKLNRPVMVDDTGMFFEAYNNFPGPNPKFVFQSIGYDGIFRLLKDKSRKAYFASAAAYCEPGGEPVENGNYELEVKVIMESGQEGNWDYQIVLQLN